MIFDSHNHLQSARFGRPVRALIAEMKAAGISGCVVNATQESDWEAVRGIACEFPDFVRPAYGIHPWFAETAKVGWEERLKQILYEDARSSVGEIGIDGWIKSPSLKTQEEIFSKQIEIAVEMDRIVTVHCLKAWDELFLLMDKTNAWPKKFLMHSFSGSAEVAQRLHKRGAWFSFSGYFLQPRKHKVLEIFKGLPKNRILLETDAPEMAPPQELMKFSLSEDVNHPANLASIAEAFGKEMGEGILAQIAENGLNFWSQKMG